MMGHQKRSCSFQHKLDGIWTGTNLELITNAIEITFGICARNLTTWLQSAHIACFIVQVLIGVMTAAQFVDNRAKAVWKTWAQQIYGDVIFFSSEGSKSE
mgnify:CR=1 FL=1